MFAKIYYSYFFYNTFGKKFNVKMHESLARVGKSVKKHHSITPYINIFK